MKFSYFQSIPTIVGIAVFSSLLTQAASAVTTTFSFDPLADDIDSSIINNWDHGGSVGVSDGWTDFENIGTATDSASDVSITLTGAPNNTSSHPNLFGTAATGGGNFNSNGRNLTTEGLEIANINNSDYNGTTLTPGSGSVQTLSGGTLENYQLLTFTFSEPVIIDSSTRFFIDDIDDATTDSYIEAIAIEAFATPTVGTRGTGIDPNFTFETPTELSIGSIDVDSTESINYVYDSVNSNRNPRNELPNRAYYDFDSTPIQSIALYYFNGISSSDTGGHGIVLGGIFEVEEAFPATAVPFEFSPGLSLLLCGGGLLGVKALKQKRQQSKLDI